MFDVQSFTYHCHTDFSDGRDSLEAMCRKAKEIGFTEMGISDHLIVHKNMKQSKSYEMWERTNHVKIFKDNFQEILPVYQRRCDEIHQYSKKIGMKLLVGFEVDFFTYDGWLEEFKDFISKLDYDYLVNGNHMLFLEDCENISDVSTERDTCQDVGLCRAYLLNHFSTIECAIKSKLFQFIAHLDYVRKLGDRLYNEKDFVVCQKRIARILSEENVATEISTKGLRKLGYFYPSESWLKVLVEENVQMVISDDAHKIDELGYMFDSAEKTLSDMGFEKRLHL